MTREGGPHWRVLHLFNTAGAMVLAKTMDADFGTETRIFTRTALNPFHYDVDETGLGPWGFEVLAAVKALNADIIQVNGGLPTYRLMKRLFRRKVVVMHFRGTDARYAKIHDRGHLIHATPDVKDNLPAGAVYIPVPVDRDLFKSDGEKTPGAFTFEYGADDIALKYAKKYDLPLTILQRNVPFAKMPETLSRFEFYVDARRQYGNLLNHRSATALQALSCGAKLIDWDGSLVEEFPAEHEAHNVARRLYETYGEFKDSQS